VKRHLGWLLRLCFSGALIAYVLLHMKEPDKVLDHLSNARLSWLFWACLLVISLVAITSCRWKLLLGAQGIHLPLRTCMKWTFVGYFFNQFLPGINGGDVVKMYYVSEETPMKAAAATSVFVDRVVGMAALMLVCVTGIAVNLRSILGITQTGSTGNFLQNELVQAGILAFLFLSVVILFFALSFNSRLLRLGERIANRLSSWPMLSKVHRFFDVFKKVHRSVFSYRASPWTLIVAVAMSSMVHVMVVTVNVMVSRALGLPPLPWPVFFLIIPVINTGMAIPVNVGGCGSRETLYPYFFQSVGWTQDQAFSLAVLVYICQLLTSITGAVVWLSVRSKRQTRPPDAGGEDDRQGTS